MSDIDVPMIFAEDDYNELLRRAVAVIETLVPLDMQIQGRFYFPAVLPMRYH